MRMRSEVEILTDVDPEDGEMFTSLERVKLELGIADDDETHDVVLSDEIAAASSWLKEMIAYEVGYKEVQETFWHEEPDDWLGVRRLRLKTQPVILVEEVLIDDVVIDESRYKVNNGNGIMRLYTTSGYPEMWWMHKNIKVTYTTGWYGVTEEEHESNNIPKALQLAATQLVTLYNQSKSRDLTLKSEENVGVFRFQYETLAANLSDQLVPPGITALITPWRN